MSQGSRCAAERRSESPSAQTISIDMFLRSGVVMLKKEREFAFALFFKSGQVNTRMLFKTTRNSRTPNITYIRKDMHTLINKSKSSQVKSR
jgi:hypothetical protein